MALDLTIWPKPTPMRHNDDKEADVTLILPLEPQEEARLVAMARAKGVSTETLVREALGRILSETDSIPATATGAVLVEAMQASPYKEICLAVSRHRLPVREPGF